MATKLNDDERRILDEARTAALEVVTWASRIGKCAQDLVDQIDAALGENGGKAIEDLDLSRRSHNCLFYAGIKSVSELTALTAADLLRIPNLGSVSLAEIKVVLASMNMKLKDRNPR